MRTGLMLAAIVVATTSVPAMAADLIVTPEPEAIVPSSYSWSGAYVGATAGVISASTDVSNILFEGAPSGLDPYTIESNGWLAGLTVGVNQQWDNIVVGIEGDYSWSNAEGTFEDPVADYSITTRLQNFATLRARVGFSVDSVLLYGTAGLAYGLIEGQLDDNYAGPTTITTVDSQSQFGWTVGVGAEVGVTDNISVKAEGLYYDLGEATYTFDEGAPGWEPLTADAATTGWVGRLGVNFRF